MAFDHITNSHRNVVVEFAQWIDGPSVAVKPYQHTHAFFRDDLGGIRHTENCPRCSRGKEDKAKDLGWKDENYATCSDARLTFFKEYHERAGDNEWGKTDDINFQALQAITAELQRRERNAKLEQLYGDNSVTLYEHLT
ncbi:hypothetical protein E8E11_004289 [Didymella keratinophila]|nr:hypothetical protein E8E11_004289 [Didymella keratinophila]